MKKFLILLCIGLYSFNLHAQTDTINNDSLEVYRLLQLQTKPPSIGVEYEIVAANDDVGFNSLINLAFSDFLERDDKIKITDALINNTRLGFQQLLNIYYKQPTYPSLDGSVQNGYKISYKNNVFTSARFPKNTAELLLFGNKPYADQELDLANTKYEDWWYSALEYEFDFSRDSLPLKASLGLVLGHSYQSLKVNSAKIFTEANGEYIDAELDYSLAQTENSNALKIGGMGASVGISTGFKVSKNFSIDLSVSDLGVIYWTNINTTEVDSNFRFKGIEFQSIFDINDSIISNERDKYQEGFFAELNTKKAVLMPFQARVQFNRPVKHLNVVDFYGFISYRYLVGYIPKMGVGIHFNIHKKDKHLIRTELAYGGFNTLALGGYYRSRLSDHWHFQIGSANVLALIMPGVATGSSVFGGVYYEF